MAYEEALDIWSEVLVRFVDDQGRTDFRALAEDRAQLDSFVDYLARVSPATRAAEFSTPDETLAYYINAYNALAMHGVIERGIPEDFDSFFKRASFFKFHRIVIGGDSTSLYDLENKVIRPLGEPRVHFALNCMVRACPRLPREPFRAATLNAQLDTATREFFASDKHLRIDEEAREIRVSEILDFYTEDFVADGKTRSLPRYIGRYADLPADRELRVRFIPYDWTINQQP